MALTAEGIIQRSDERLERERLEKEEASKRMRLRFLRAVQEQNFGNIVIELREESGKEGE